MNLTYDPIVFANATGIDQIALGINSWSGNILGVVLIVVPAIIFFTLTFREDTRARIIVTAFFQTLLALLMFGLQLVGKITLAWSIGILFVGVLYFLVSE